MARRWVQLEQQWDVHRVAAIAEVQRMLHALAIRVIGIELEMDGQPAKCRLAFVFRRCLIHRDPTG